MCLKKIDDSAGCVFLANKNLSKYVHDSNWSNWHDL